MSDVRRRGDSCAPVHVLFFPEVRESWQAYILNNERLSTTTAELREHIGFAASAARTH